MHVLDIKETINKILDLGHEVGPVVEAIRNEGRWNLNVNIINKFK